jgi:hypothetical protein
VRLNFAMARVVIVLAAVAAAAVPWPAPAVGLWASVYHRVQPVVTSASNRVPFALLDALLVGVLVLLAASWGRVVRRAGRGERVRRLSQAASATLTGAAVLVLWFFLAWGLHYRQPAAERRFDVDRRRVDAAAVERLALRATEAVNGLVADAHARAAPTMSDLVGRLRPALSRTLGDLGMAARVEAGRPKPTLLAPFFRWASVAGLTDPFFLEVMVTPDALPFERPAIVAHEWSHLAGFARESDASFVGFLVCQRGDAEARYSAWLDLWLRARAQLPSTTRAAVDARLSPEVRGDLQAVAARLRRSVPAVRDAAWRGYDAYLKSQRVERGVASYDEVVVLIAGARFEAEWTPRLRDPATGPR